MSTVRPIRRRSSIAVLLAAGALALGACGGDDGGDTVGATQPTAKTQTTETDGNGTTTRERTRTRERDRTTEERGDDSGGGNRGSGSGGSGGGSNGSRGSDDSGSTSQPAAQPGNVRKVAQTVCNSFLPKATQRELEKGDRKAEDVARDYSRAFPEKQREAAYEGCLAGLEKRN